MSEQTVTSTEPDVPESGADGSKTAEVIVSDAGSGSDGSAATAPLAGSGDEGETLDVVGEIDMTDLGAPTLAAALEALLLVADVPMPVLTLASITRRPAPEVAQALVDLTDQYAAAGRGFDLREVAGGWRFYTRDDCAAVVERFVRDGQQARLTQAALETLAVVAYRQPVSRARVSAVRGVNVDGVIRTLVSRGLIEECGTDDDSGAYLYRTTSLFLERLGLRSLDELPILADYLPDIATIDLILDETLS
jgi:segregation and condensation protein B